MSFTASAVPIHIPNDGTGKPAGAVVGSLSFSDDNTALGPWTVELVAGQGDNSYFVLSASSISTIGTTVNVSVGASPLPWNTLRGKAVLVVKLTDNAGNFGQSTIAFAGS